MQQNGDAQVSGAELKMLGVVCGTWLDESGQLLRFGCEDTAELHGQPARGLTSLRSRHRIQAGCRHAN